MRSIELFAGAGGLAIGIHQAGFRPSLIVERDKSTCITVRANQQRGFHPLVDAQLFDQDIKFFDYGEIREPVDFISGGPPCQPFSMGGKHRAHEDEGLAYQVVHRLVNAAD